MNRRFFMMMISAVAVSLMSASFAQADEVGDLQKRFKERYPKLAELRNDGTLGETWDGWTEAVKEATPEVAAFVAAESADRKRLYAIIAERQGAKPEEVGERNAVRIFKSAEPHHYLKLKDGKWVQRKDIELKD